MKKIIIIIILVVYSNISFSQNDIIGLGLAKCSTFYNSNTEDKIIFMSWVAGFISSESIKNKKTYNKNISYDRSIIWLEYFCHNHPDKSFREATESFIDKFLTK
tara:strand:+ start:928 stop:1239 length:312 start_codon:yes stop_codon:yes gene_type:complete